MIRIDGVGKTIEAMRRIYDKDVDTADGALGQCADMVLVRSQTYVPVDTAKLKKSGRKEKEYRTKTQFRYRVVYGGPGAPYAMIVHEMPDVVHAPPTCYKYLERATRELKGTMAALIRRRLQASLGTPTVKLSTGGFTS